MPTRLITEDLWPSLTRAIRTSKRPCQVAVAYLGQGAAQMLPLPKGSRLVVDASDRTVKLGLTCPAELLKLHKKGVEVFSVMNLHAKVYVAGKNAFIGSANASQHSAGTLIETLLHTTEPQAVKQARQFVEDLCLQSLGPEQLKALVKIYRPPHLPGGKRGKRIVPKKTVKPELAEVYLAQLKERKTLTKEQEKERQAGLKEARRARQHRASTHELDDFSWEGRCDFRPGHEIIQVFKERGGKTWVYPPAHVLKVRRHPQQKLSFVYVEYPNCHRKSIEVLAAKLGRGALTKLRRNGRAKDRTFVHALLKAWNAQGERA